MLAVLIVVLSSLVPQRTRRAIRTPRTNKKLPSHKGREFTRGTTLVPASAAPGAVSATAGARTRLERALVGVQPYPRRGNGQRPRLGLLVADSVAGHVRRAAQEGLRSGRSARSHHPGLAELRERRYSSPSTL